MPQVPAVEEPSSQRGPLAARIMEGSSAPAWRQRRQEQSRKPGLMSRVLGLDREVAPVSEPLSWGQPAGKPEDWGNLPPMIDDNFQRALDEAEEEAWAILKGVYAE